MKFESNKFTLLAVHKFLVFFCTFTESLYLYLGRLLRIDTGSRRMFRCSDKTSDLS